LLRAYGEGLDTDAALERSMGVNLEGLQGSFDAALEKKFGALRKAMALPSGGLPQGGDRLASLKLLAAANPGSYPVLLALGDAQASAGDVDAAMQTLEKAAVLVPVATGKESARGMLAELALQKGDKTRAMKELVLLLDHDHTDVEAARQLAALAEGASDEALMWRAYERIIALDPFDGPHHSAYGRLALKRGQVEIAQREFRAALAGNPVDLAGAHCDLAESYLAGSRPADAKTQVLAALEVAPTFARAQELLLRLVDTRAR
jgi:tetratricopeptide (TPR) repeat protein